MKHSVYSDGNVSQQVNYHIVPEMKKKIYIYKKWNRLVLKNVNTNALNHLL